MFRTFTALLQPMCFSYFSSCYMSWVVSIGEADDDFVKRQEQLNLQPAKRGKGKGRGRGRGSTATKRSDHDDPEVEVPEKKRKIATPQTFWTDDVSEEWARCKAMWDKEWQEEEVWGQESWGQSSQAFDHYAHLDGQVSLHSLVAAEGDGCSGEGKAKKVEKAPKKKTTKKKHIEVLEEKADDASVESEEETCHTNQKEQVKAIAQHIKDVLALGIRVKKFEDLTKQTKDSLREPFPNTDECRYTPYWNRPACGFYLKSEGMDGGCFSVQSEHGPYLHRLVASMKAAQLMATWHQKNIEILNHFAHVHTWMGFHNCDMLLTLLTLWFEDKNLVIVSYWHPRRLRWTTSRTLPTRHAQRMTGWVNMLIFQAWKKHWNSHQWRLCSVWSNPPNADCFYGFLLVCCDVAQLAMLNNLWGLVPKLQTTWPPGGLQCKSRSAVCAFGWDFLNMIFI